LDSIKFGIIGCSRIAKRSVIPAILKSEFAELEIIGSRTLEKSNEFSNEFNCKKSGTYDDVISDDSVDAVYISTPIGTHKEWVMKAASAGKHIYCEKSFFPQDITQETAKEVVYHAKQNNVRMMEGFMFRFHPQHQKVKELIDDKKIGNLISFSGSFGFPAFPEGDIRYNKELGGGFLNDSGCYPVSASRMVFNEEPLAVFHTNVLDPKTGVDVKGTSLLIYENEKTATITYGNGNYYQATYDVWGSDGIISLDRAYSVPPDFTTKVNLQYNIKNNWDGRRNKIFEIKPRDHFLEMIDTFCMEINGEGKAPFNFEQELLNQSRVMSAHYHSCSSKKMVWLDEDA